MGQGVGAEGGDVGGNQEDSSFRFSLWNRMIFVAIVCSKSLYRNIMLSCLLVLRDIYVGVQLMFYTLIRVIGS